MKFPRITVVTPNLNRAAALEATMNSVLNGGYEALEYMVLDGGSTDGSIDVLRRRESHLAYWRSRSDAGPYAAINEGFARGTGEIMAWLNSGDLYYPWTLRVVAELFARYPEVEWIMGAPAKIQEGAVHAVAPARPYPRQLLRLGLFDGGEFGVVQQESCFWKRSLWEESGSQLDEQYVLAADFELWTRFADRAELHCCEALLGGFSIDGCNRSLRQEGQYKLETVRVVASLDHSFARQRSAVLAAVRVHRMCRPFTGLRGLSRRVLQIDRWDGPVIRRDFAQNSYKIDRLSFFA